MLESKIGQRVIRTVLGGMIRQFQGDAMFTTTVSFDSVQLEPMQILGGHNYCRSMDLSSPWCYVKLENGTLVVENCNVPKCRECPCGEGECQYFRPNIVHCNCKPGFVNHSRGLKLVLEIIEFSFYSKFEF